MGCNSSTAVGVADQNKKPSKDKKGKNRPPTPGNFVKKT